MAVRSSDAMPNPSLARPRRAPNPRPAGRPGPAVCLARLFFDPRDLVQVKYEISASGRRGVPWRGRRRVWGLAPDVLSDAEPPSSNAGSPVWCRANAGRTAPTNRRHVMAFVATLRAEDRRSACGRYCRGFTIALGSTYTRGVSSVPCARGKKKTPLSERPTSIGGARDGHARGELRSIARIARVQRRPDGGPSSVGDPAPSRRGGLLRAWARCPSPTDTGGPPRTAPRDPALVHTELVQLWAHMALSHQEVAWI